MFGETSAELARTTGVSEARIGALEAAAAMPTGDEILILADHFKLEDYRFLISNEQQTALERTEKLFRAYASELSTSDRWAIQEFLFLCENESFLLHELGRPPRVRFAFVPKGTYFKAHGDEAAERLRRALGHSANEVPDVFHDLRALGFHVFRRRLDNENISGLFIDHPTAGPSILVNYSEDVYRQRFTAAHEAAHAIFDRDQEYVVSFVPSSSRWSHDRLREVRADTFAAAFLMSPTLLRRVDGETLTEDMFLDLADRLKVNVEPLRRALVRDGRLTDAAALKFRGLRIPRNAKNDPELPLSLTPKQRTRKVRLLQQGLSSYYVDLCFEACQRGFVTRSRTAEMLMLDEAEMSELQQLFQGGGHDRAAT
ncbi:ImmA/IrrE family metallo-endopeptidase [Sorangium sp. So ce590]|uniref:ImmA/IrrE family metallo-endopeptidase n=1 Tax=Sorangium sp. So ce590 TaxID=3133317 RepID=UPI003F5EF5EF